MHDSYIIDGYNLIHALGMIERDLDPGGLEDSRRKLLAFLVQGFGNSASGVTVVFDAQHAPRGVPRQTAYHGLHVHFAPKQLTADDWIEKLIADCTEPRSLVVVSNDLRLQSAARQRNARAWSHEKLLDYLEGPAATPRTSRPDSNDKDSPEEREHWLKEFKALEDDPELREFFDMDKFE